MTTITDILKGLEILAKYNPTCHVYALDDMIATEKRGVMNRIKEEDAATLDALGWEYDEDSDQWSRYC